MGPLVLDKINACGNVVRRVGLPINQKIAQNQKNVPIFLDGPIDPPSFLSTLGGAIGIQGTEITPRQHALECSEARAQ